MNGRGCGRKLLRCEIDPSKNLPTGCEKVKVKVHPCKALRLCTGRTANRGSRGIAILYRH